MAVSVQKNFSNFTSFCIQSSKCHPQHYMCFDLSLSVASVAHPMTQSTPQPQGKCVCVCVCVCALTHVNVL